MSSLETDSAPMARQLPPNLVTHFTQALKSYQVSNATFHVLCSLTPSVSSSPLAIPAPQTPKVLPKRLLVLDSSFNPPTLAHQQMALSAFSEYRQAGGDNSNDDDDDNKSRVLLLLAINNADKAPKPAIFPQRLSMMYLFAQDLLASTTATKATYSEGDCEGVDIAVTTEPYFHAKSSAVSSSDFYRGPKPVEQVYLTGFDTLIRIFDPKYYPDNSMAQVLDPFFAHAQLRVSMRTDAEWGDSAAQLAYLEGLRLGGLDKVGGKMGWVNRILMVEGRKDGEEVISSTKVRAAVLARDWDALKKLVSEEVTNWIRREGLYAEVGA
ncbi:Nucleotidylyl transferase [Annulohypoxylon maeteangense]|uniref:Nucleotidylyl transferase n=1 Tax=Annulohypoxylon maeteangense TaxID=1927788 RepID=UPI0020084C56|nr:Nucleotidylyl transferase [Annulohypoxylon maeteangense]KAI0880125.1 Nucleotidylyl transferase [Annulohypoxylon maeteangense]